MFLHFIILGEIRLQIRLNVFAKQVDTKRKRPDGKLYCLINSFIHTKTLYILKQDTLSMREV